MAVAVSARNWKLLLSSHAILHVPVLVVFHECMSDLEDRVLARLIRRRASELERADHHTGDDVRTDQRTQHIVRHKEQTGRMCTSTSVLHTNNPSEHDSNASHHIHSPNT